MFPVDKFQPIIDFRKAQQGIQEVSAGWSSTEAPQEGALEHYCRTFSGGKNRPREYLKQNNCCSMHYMKYISLHMSFCPHYLYIQTFDLLPDDLQILLMSFKGLILLCVVRLNVSPIDWTRSCCGSSHKGARSYPRGI